MKQAGFTVLEVLVALVIVSSSGMALLSWMNSSTMALERAEQYLTEELMIANATDYIRLINPMAQPEGEYNYGEEWFSWQAKAVTAERQGVSYPNGRGYYTLQMFKVTVELYWQSEFLYDFELYQVGYRQDIFPSAEPFF